MNSTGLTEEESGGFTPISTVCVCVCSHSSVSPLRVCVCVFSLIGVSSQVVCVLMVCFHILELLFDETAMPRGMEVSELPGGCVV